MFHQSNMFGAHHQLLDLANMHNTPDSEFGNIRDDEFESSRSGTDNPEGLSGDEQDPNQHSNKKKKYHRHTQHQIQEMENFFKECPHPDDKQRKELSRRLSLEPLQVKFWFQNKRTQMKAQNERSENQQLRSEIDKLRADNMRCKAALSNASCPNCGGPPAIVEMSLEEQQLRMENAQLREEIDRISEIAAKYTGKPIVPYSHQQNQGLQGRSSLELGVGSFGPQSGTVGDIYGSSGDLLRSVGPLTEADKPMIIELAISAMEELIRMAQAGEPLWFTSPDNLTEILNEEEHFRTFPRGVGPSMLPLGLKSEASRDATIVIMNPLNLVGILMDANQWSCVFSGIVSNAMTIDVLSTGMAGNYNGAVQVMTAEFQVPSPLVPTRESYFVRYCRQHGDNTWAVVDVSLDGLLPNPISKYRRRPSGCLIQELPNGFSKVVWVEHVELDDDREVHNIYRTFVDSGLAFGAKRWVSTLDRQCERLASVMATNIPAGEGGVTTSPEGRKSMLKLAERMVQSFLSGVGASTAHSWTTLSGSGAEDVRVMTRKSLDDPGKPPGIVLSAAASLWMPVSPKQVFDFLRDENSRNEWDILSNGGLVQEMVHIANGRDPGNYVSLLRVNSANTSQSNMLILQESITDATGSYVIYAPVDIVAMNMVLNGGDPDYVALLPSGFAILPNGPAVALGNRALDVGSGGTLLTVAFQILVDSVPTAKLSLSSVATINSLIKCTVERIKTATGCVSVNQII